MADETVDLDVALKEFNQQVEAADARREAEQENRRHFMAFDLTAEFAAYGVSFDEAYRMLQRCRWSVKRARKELWATHAHPPA